MAFKNFVMNFVERNSWRLNQFLLASCFFASIGVCALAYIWCSTLLTLTIVFVIACWLFVIACWPLIRIYFKAPHIAMALALSLIIVILVMQPNELVVAYFVLPQLYDAELPLSISTLLNEILPVDSKESSFPQQETAAEAMKAVPELKVHCVEQFVSGEFDLTILFSETDKSLLARNVNKIILQPGASVPKLPNLLTYHFVNKIKISSIFLNSRYFIQPDYHLLVNCYTNSSAFVNEPNIFLSNSDLVGSPRFQYSTHLYQIDHSYVRFCRETELKGDSFVTEFNHIVKINTYTPYRNSSQFFLVTGDRDFLEGRGLSFTNYLKPKLPCYDLHFSDVSNSRHLKCSQFFKK